MRSPSLLTLVLFTVFSSAYGQGEIPVDMYTGTPSISVPIWNVVSGSISEPVSLSYNANAAQQKSLFGPGWSVSAGGSITREVRGYPDDEAYLIKGWMYPTTGGSTCAATIGNYTVTADTLASTTSDEYHASILKDWNKLNAFNYLVDTEPDIFHYSFGGMSGSFVIGADMLPHTIPYADIKIEMDYVSETDKQILGFTVTTNNGNSYSFYTKVASTKSTVSLPWTYKDFYATTENELYKTPVDFTREWKLSSIYSPDGSNIIFAYGGGLSASSERIEDVGLYQYPDPIYGPAKSDLLKQTAYKMTESGGSLVISSITASTGPKVEFSYNGNLRSINISDERRGTTSTEKYVKSFTLTYRPIIYVLDQYANYQQSTSEFLSAITENSGCEKIPPYRFEYTGVYELKYPYNPGFYLPAVKGVDLWGFSNGVDQEHSFPKIYIYPDEPLAERYRTNPIPNYPNTKREYILEGVNRRSSTSGMLPGTLQSITTPEGGTTAFEFEANDYIDTRITQRVIAGGLRIKSISYFDGFNPLPIKKTFTYEDGQLIRKPVFAKPAFRWKSAGGTTYDRTYTSPTMTDEEKWKYLTIRTTNDQSLGETTHGNTVGYKTVTVKRTGAGSSKHEFLIPALHGQYVSGDWRATSIRFARPSTFPSMGVAADVSGTGNVAGGGPWSFPNSPNPDVDYQRGLPWKTSEYDEAGVLVRKTEITYQDIHKSGAPLKVWGLKYDRFAGCDLVDKTFFLGKYFLLTETQRVPRKEKTTTYDPASGTYLKDSVEYLYESSAHKLLSQIKRYTSDGKIYSTRLKYPKDYYYTLSGATDATSIAYLQIYNRHGIPVEQLETLKKGIDSTEYVIGGRVIKLDPFNFGSSRQLVRSTWKLKTNPVIALSNFQHSFVQSTTNKFRIDPRYERTDSILSYTTLGSPKARRNPFSRQTSMVGYGYNSTLPIVQLINTQLNSTTDIQAGFSDFETTTGFEFTSTAAYYGAGRTGQKAFHASQVLSKVINRAPNVTNYILSFWIKSDQNISFSVTFKTAAGAALAPPVTSSFTVQSTNSEYKYIQNVIPLTTAPSQFKVELSSGLAAPGSPASGGYLSTLMNVIDDVFFYPENTDMIATTYTIPFGPASVTTGSGSTSYTEYDKLGRLRYVYDHDRNIVKRNTYQYSVESPLIADFTTNIYGSAITGQAITFTAASNPCVTETLTYEWDIGSGYTTGTSTKSNTFTTAGTYQVSIRVTSTTFGSKTVTKNIVVQNPPLLVDICAKGVASMANGTITQYQVPACSSGSPPAQGVLYKVTPVNTNPGETFSYQWVMRDLASSSWTHVGTNSSQYTFPKVNPNTPSFVVKCELTSNQGRSIVSGGIEVIVTP